MVNTMKSLEHLTWPTISVVITTYKRPNSLLKVLDCLREQKHTDFRDIDVCIVNDGSHGAGYRDDYNELYPFEVLYIPKDRAEDGTPRLYSLKNFGVRATTGQVIWLLDDDLIFDDHTLFILRTYHMLLEHARPVLIPHYADNREPYHYQNPFPFISQPADWNVLRVWSSFAGMSFRRRDFEGVGGIDEGYDGSMGFADLDLGIRLWKDGCQVCLGDGITCFIDDSETGSHRDGVIYQQLKTDPHRNGRYFIEKWGSDEASDYNVKWTHEDERQFGIEWDREQQKFVRV